MFRLSRTLRPIQSVQSIQKRFLSIHEYRGAELLKQYGVGVPEGYPAFSPEEAEVVAKKLGKDDMVVKAQVLAGGRGKGTFTNGLKGGVRPVYSPSEAKLFASQMIGQRLITKQTGSAGKPCNAVYICDKLYIRREYYLAILMDRTTQGPMIVASSQGGVDIETVAAESPEAIITLPVNIADGLSREDAVDLAKKMDFAPHCVEEAAGTIEKLYQIFTERDATQIEINPLAESNDHHVVAMDAKFGFDDNAEFRQEEVFSWRDRSQENPDEVKAAEYGLNFIKLDGSIGCLVNGAGLAMATMDIIKLNGGEPANFLDCGGGATAKAIEEAFKLITNDPKVTAVFVNIFGGIVRCDSIAQGLINTVSKQEINIPIVARLQGTNMKEAQELIADSGLRIFSFPDLDQAAQKACQFSKVVQLARSSDLNVSFTLEGMWEGWRNQLKRKRDSDSNAFY